MNKENYNYDGGKSTINYEEKIYILHPHNHKEKIFSKKTNVLFLCASFLLIILLFLFLYNSNIIWKQNKSKALNTADNKILEESVYKAAEKGLYFLNNSYEGILISQIPLLVNFTPKVSVVIPVYNSESTLLRAIRSIQNQNFTEFEIILVNDFSTDKSNDLIEILKKEDNRIKVINNKKNMGILYSRCIGTLSSQSKYIFPLDNDDMLLDKDVIDAIYNEINNNDFDIIYFRGISVYHFHDILNKKNLMSIRSFINHKILYQPELGNYAIKRFVLWTQCIKSELYKKTINSYGEDRYSKYVTFYEDAIINYINNQLAEKAELFLKFGILHIDKPWTASKRVKQKKRNIYELYFIETLFDFSRNSTDIKEIAANKIIYLLSYKDFKESLDNEKDKDFFISLIKKIFSSEYITDKKKEIIKEKIASNELLNITNIF